MDCFCGCERKLGRKLAGANIQASEVALELLAWDKARSADYSASAGDEESLIGRGAEVYRRLLSTLHGEPDGGAAESAEEWLRESRRMRSKRDDMTDRGSGVLFRRARLRLTDADLERLDRKRPELSFSGARDSTGSEDTHKDPVAHLRGLGELHEAGVLTDEEFAAAKARVATRP